MKRNTQKLSSVIFAEKLRTSVTIAIFNALNLCVSVVWPHSKLSFQFPFMLNKIRL